MLRLVEKNININENIWTIINLLKNEKLAHVRMILMKKRYSISNIQFILKRIIGLLNGLKRLNEIQKIAFLCQEVLKSQTRVVGKLIKLGIEREFEIFEFVSSFSLPKDS